ncbi:MAG: hypothetical protein ABSE15_03590 [Candidatus Bathyarchaeia archaeon]|jgi:hypothetical protein
MNMRKTIVLIIAVVVVAALVATGLAIINQNANKAANPGTSPGATKGISVDQAVTAAQTYLTRMGYPNLGIKMMQEYSNTYYAQVVEQNNGTGAFELAVNKNTGVVTPMQGPILMWNTKYGTTGTGMMGYLTTTSPSSSGMMGGSGGMMTWLRGTPTTNMAVTMEQARTYARQYLDANYTGATVGQVTTFYGYYTMQVMKNGNVFGIMGVYGNTGQVMYYSWCGSFMQQKTLG